MTPDFSTPALRLAFVMPIASVYSLDPALVCAIIEQESDWIVWAIRPEPAFEQRYVLPLHENILETWSRSMSWGLMQLMGEVARELGFRGTYLSELCDPETGVHWGCDHFRNKLHTAGNDIRKALLLWNGGSNLSYPDQVLARLPKYQ